MTTCFKQTRWSIGLLPVTSPWPNAIVNALPRLFDTPTSLAFEQDMANALHARVYDCVWRGLVGLTESG
jgi:hypothetical protein